MKLTPAAQHLLQDILDGHDMPWMIASSKMGIGDKYARQIMLGVKDVPQSFVRRLGEVVRLSDSEFELLNAALNKTTMEFTLPASWTEGQIIENWKLARWLFGLNLTEEQCRMVEEKLSRLDFNDLES